MPRNVGSKDVRNDSGPPSAEAPVVRGYFGIGAESGTRSSRFECKDPGQVSAPLASLVFV